MTVMIDRIKEDFDNYGLPEYMWSDVELYLIYGAKPGGFLLSVLENAPFTEVIARADDKNKKMLQEWAWFVYNSIPAGAWGNPGFVAEWMASKNGDS